MNFKIVKGEIQEFAILDENFNSDNDNININCGLVAKLNFDKRLIAIENVVKYTYENRDLLKLKSVMYFEIHQDSWKANEGDKNFILEKGIAQHFGIITLGATRGMLISKTTNTSMSPIVLPPININSIIPSDIKFDLTNK